MSPLKRGTKPLVRKTRLSSDPSKALRRTGKLKANAKRRKSEFARCYGSKERVAWVKGLGCLVCLAASPLFYATSAGKCDNAHVGGNDGMGRKGPYTEIVPLCREHHRRFDEHRHPCDIPEMRRWLLTMAATIEKHWQSHLQSKGQAA